jgi:hypothetical protein
MSALERQRAEGLDPNFWERLERLERRHWRLQWEHEHAGRDLKRLSPSEAEGLQLAWQRYCKVIAELDQATAEIESLRTCAG